MRSLTVRYSLVAIGLLYFHFSTQAQLIVNNTYTIQNLVQNVLLGSGVYASNITYTGNSLAVGYFDGQNTNLGIDSGIVLSSGDVSKIPGSASNFSTTSNNTSGDADLESLITGTGKSKDAAVIEFDFYTFSNTVTFKYVFGSEEYPNYACSNYNDVFGFFISGPNIVGKQNIALVPGTTIPVSINNVNNGGGSCTSANNPTYYVDNAGLGGTTVSFNGFTTVLEATFNIIPCQTYHIKLAIADVYDGVYDSGVFLEAQSFNAGVTVSSEPTVKTPLPDSSLYEGCGYSILTFAKLDSTSSISTFYLSYSGSASNGVDYVTLPDSIEFLPGQDTVTLMLVPIGDAFAEGTETVDVLVSGGSCASALGNISLTILDHPALVLSISNDTTIQCPTDSILRNASASGGVEPFTYIWETADTIASIYVPAQASSTYSVIATDLCGYTIEDSTTVTINNYTQLTVSLPNDTNLCEYETAWIKAEVNGGKAQYTFVWEGLTNIEDSVLANPDSIETFIVFVTDSCGMTASDTMSVTSFTFVPSFVYNFESNFDVSFTNVTLDGTVIAWDFGTGDSSFLPNPVYTFPEAGNYTVQMLIQNSLGCIDTVYQLIIVKPEFNAFIPNTFSPNGDAINDFFGARLEKDTYEEYHMQIYDRWGRLIFQSDTMEDMWNGKNQNDEKCPVGAYSYSFQFVDSYGNYHSRIGSISLIK